MKTRSTFLLTLILFTASIVSSSFGQGESASPGTSSTSVATEPVAAPQMNDAEMMKIMMEMSKLNENHKLLADLAGTWSFTVKMMANPADPTSKAQESKGTAVRKSVMGGRYFELDVNGKMQMPGADGKMKDVDFKGMGLEGYDNAKKKFVSTWVDNMGTSIMMSEGDYDPTTKTFTYTGDYQMAPQMKQKIREVIKVADKNHHTFEYYEIRGGQDAKTMEINYTRASGK